MHGRPRSTQPLRSRRFLRQPSTPSVRTLVPWSRATSARDESTVSCTRNCAYCNSIDCFTESACWATASAVCTLLSCAGLSTRALSVSIGMRDSSGTVNCFANRCISAMARGAKPSPVTAVAGVARFVPVAMSPSVNVFTTIFFSRSGSGSSTTRTTRISKRFRLRSYGSASATPCSSSEPLSRWISRSAMSSCAPSALVPASAMVSRMNRSAKSIQPRPSRARTSSSGMMPSHRKTRVRARREELSPRGPPPGAAGVYCVCSPLRTEPGVDIVELRSLESLVRARLPHALADRGAIAHHTEASQEKDRDEQREPDDDAPQHHRVVEVRQGKTRRVLDARPERTKRYGADEQRMADAIEHGIEQEADRDEHRPCQHASRERNVQHREQQQHHEVVRVHERREPERCPERDAERDLRRRTVGMQRFDERANELEESQHRWVVRILVLGRQSGGGGQATAKKYNARPILGRSSDAHCNDDSNCWPGQLAVIATDSNLCHVRTVILQSVNQRTVNGAPSLGSHACRATPASCTRLHRHSRRHAGARHRREYRDFQPREGGVAPTIAVRGSRPRRRHLEREGQGRNHVDQRSGDP